MASTELLRTYLNDHLAGAAAGSELAKKISAEHQGTSTGEFLAELAQDIEQDRVTLAELADRLGVEKDPVKEAAGWFMEKFSRVKLSDRFTGSAELKLLLEFETLSLGIEGKLALWRSLQQVSDRHPELDDTELDSLVKRAQDQRSRLEEHRLETAKRALAG
jgi:hypothetical protein